MSRPVHDDIWHKWNNIGRILTFYKILQYIAEFDNVFTTKKYYNLGTMREYQRWFYAEIL